MVNSIDLHDHFEYKQPNKNDLYISVQLKLGTTGEQIKMKEKYPNIMTFALIRVQSFVSAFSHNHGYMIIIVLYIKK